MGMDKLLEREKTEALKALAPPATKLRNGDLRKMDDGTALSLTKVENGDFEYRALILPRKELTCFCYTCGCEIPPGKPNRNCKKCREQASKVEQDVRDMQGDMQPVKPSFE